MAEYDVKTSCAVLLTAGVPAVSSWRNVKKEGHSGDAILQYIVSL
jgi:hypothetical protein